mgnify:FL=1
MWISEFESAILGTVRIGSYNSEEEAFEKTDKWLKETIVSDGENKTTMLKLVEEDFSCDVYIYEDTYGDYELEEDDD